MINQLLKKLLAIGLTVVAIVLLPLLGAVIKYGQKFPKGFFEFPPMFHPNDVKAPFNLTVFIIFAIVCLILTAIYVVPQWFGFKKPVPQVPSVLPKLKLPLWFWIGVFLTAFALFFLWGKFDHPKIITNWTLIPLFWGIILTVDGWVFYRNRGNSILNDKPQTLIAIAVCSIGGWLIYEYLNLFVKCNWFYPEGDMISTEQFFIYSIIGSSGLLTIAFEWYTLLKTFKGFAARFKQGLRIKLPRTLVWILFVASLCSMFAISIFPNALFFLIWTAPMVALICALHLAGYWTPFTPIGKKGDWSPILLICLSYFIQGLLYECWNYFSAYHLADGRIVTYNPGFWVYSIPYVNVLHVFEMPLLGLFGYLPFGLYCWTAWLIFAHLLGNDPLFDDEDMSV